MRVQQELHASPSTFARSRTPHPVEIVRHHDPAGHETQPVHLPRSGASSGVNLNQRLSSFGDYEGLAFCSLFDER